MASNGSLALSLSGASAHSATSDAADNFLHQQAAKSVETRTFKCPFLSKWANNLKSQLALILATYQCIPLCIAFVSKKKIYTVHLYNYIYL